MAQLQFLSNQIVIYKYPSNLKGKIKKTKNIINQIAKKHKKEIVLIEINFISDEELLEINRNSLNHDYYTDIITFDYGNKNFIESDIYISIDRVKDNAKTLNKTIEEELLRVIFHGILHLVGFKDKTKSESIKMINAENLYIDAFYKI